MIFEIDEDLWFSTKANKLAEERAAQSMAALSGKVFGAKPFPQAAHRLAKITSDPDYSVDKAVGVLESDPALSASLLRMVNSAAYGLRGRCSSLRQAVTLVGASKLRQICTTAAILDMFHSSSHAAIAVLEHGSIVAAFCRYLAPTVGLSPDELFTCGFLHDLGKLMMLDSGLEDYPALLDQHLHHFDAMHVEERGRYGFDHGVLAAHVLTAWNIPSPIPRIVGWHHQAARAYKEGGTTASLVAAVRLADEACYLVDSAHKNTHLNGQNAQGESLLPPAEQLARSEAAQVLGLDAPTLMSMWPDFVSLRRRAGALVRGESVDESEPPTRRAPMNTVARAAPAPVTTVEIPGGTPVLATGAPLGAPIELELAPMDLSATAPSARLPVAVAHPLANGPHFKHAVSPHLVAPATNGGVRLAVVGAIALGTFATLYGLTGAPLIAVGGAGIAGAAAYGALSLLRKPLPDQ